MVKCSGWRFAMPPYIVYWKAILEEVEKLLPPTPTELAKGYWPIHDWRVTVPALLCLVINGNVTAKAVVSEVFCGLSNERSKETLNPWQHIIVESWVLLPPSDPDINLVCMGRAWPAINMSKDTRYTGSSLSNSGSQ